MLDNKNAKERKNENEQAVIEKRYLFFITHLLNERIDNKFYFEFEEDLNFIESERAADDITNGDITKLLRKYYEFNIIEKYIANNYEDKGVAEIKAQAFLFDNSENNELFQFFTVAGEPFESGVEFSNSVDCKFKGLLTSQAFFYDDNLGIIREKINSKNKKEDIFFIDNVLSENFGKNGKHPESLIIRFGIDEEIGVNNHANREVEQQERRKQDNSIYFQIWGFDKNNSLHWFALKLLLTLRNNFVKLRENVYGT